MNTKQGQSSYGEIVNEKVFKQDVIDFAHMLGQTMDKQVHEMSSKYSFDFSND